MIRQLFSRIGCLLLFFGIIFLIIGMTVAQSGEPPLTQYFFGFIMTFSGFLLWIRLRKKPSQNRRFSLFRRRGKRNTEKEDNVWENQFYD